ncbi:hypothetical protein AAG906_008344 [Vitis piasezkii]
MQRALENQVTKHQCKNEQMGNITHQAYSLVGFPYVFQVWVYETILIIGMKYVNHVAKSCPRILNWRAISTLMFTKLQQIFLDCNLSLCSLLKPTLDKCQQDYYKYLNKLTSVNGVPPKNLSQPTTQEHDTMGDLKDEDHPIEAIAYVAATMENKNKKDYSILPSIENLWIEFIKHIEKFESNFNYLKKKLKEVNRKIDNLRQLLLDKNIGMDFNSLDDKFETLMEDKEDENHGHIDVDIDYLHADKEWFESLVQHGSWLKYTHIDVVVYFFPNVKAMWEKHAKKWNQFQMQANDILVDYVNGLHPTPSMNLSEVDIVYVPINVRSIMVILKVKNGGTLNGCMMFLNKKYLMHDHPFRSLTGARIDWFREKMTIELFYFKNLPM